MAGPWLQTRAMKLFILFLGLWPIILAGAEDAPDENIKDEQLLWGPYRPNLYFGVRPRIPKSLLTSLIWGRIEDYQNFQHDCRFTCEQNEGMEGYGWDEYDARTGGRQTIHDAKNHIDITTEFVKVHGGDHGGNWAARIKGTPRAREDTTEELTTTVFFTVALEGDGYLAVNNTESSEGYDGSVFIKGNSPELGDFAIEITQGPDTNKNPDPTHPLFLEKPLDRTRVRSMQVPEAALWQSKGIVFQDLKEELEAAIEKYDENEMPPPWQIMTIGHNVPAAGNVHIVQKVFKGAFEFDILYTSASTHAPISSGSIPTLRKMASERFGKRFSTIFKRTAPFDSSKYDAFSKSMFSNLLGGVGYFYGDEIVDRSYAPEYDEEEEGFWEDAAEARARVEPKLEGPYELYTAVPSRPFFPRGFLWDEGFHLLPILEWDAAVAFEVVHSWLRLMDKDGWIAREQILGQEARSKVPPEFQVQYPHYANPPTLFLVFDALLDKMRPTTFSTVDRVTNTEALRHLYPMLKKHYYWYRRTQQGDIKSYDREAFSTKEGYRWRGRTPAHILTSGMDDYPRAQPPHPGELHVDLLSWIGLMTNSLKDIAEVLGEKDDAAEFEGYANAIKHNIDDLHWDEAAQAYCDATIDAYEESIHVCHKGYISIFPFFTGLISHDSPRLGPILDLIGNPNELWSNHGIRSLSKSDKFYNTEENYWRSPVWMNINYLVLDNLAKVAQESGPQQGKALQLYTDLRQNLVNTIFKSWQETGFAWEQYNPETGAGQRTQHFTGWTSLVVKIMCMPDLRPLRAGHSEL